nr:hypothetical protein [Aquisalinus luteolus]
MAIQFRDLGLDGVGELRRAVKLVVPHRLEDGPDHPAMMFGWLQGVEHIDEVAFELVAPDRFAVADAILVVAEIIGMAVAGLAFRPVGRQRSLAIATQDKATQRKVFVEVTTRRNLSLFLQTILDRSEGLIVDQRLVVALAQRDIPFSRLHISGID